MRKNTSQVYQAWVEGKALKVCDSIHTDGCHIYSYGTCLLAKGNDDTIVFNATEYSPTTTRQQVELMLLMSGSFLGFRPMPYHPLDGFSDRGVGPAALLDAYKPSEFVPSIFGDSNHSNEV